MIRSFLLVCALPVSLSAQEWKDLERIADSLVRNGRSDSAVAVLTEAITVAGKRYGENDTTVATVMRERAFHLRGREEFSAAEKDLRDSYDIFENVLGPDNINVAHAATELGLFYEDQDRYSDADEWLRRALEIKVRTLGPIHFEVGRSQHHLAIISNSRGAYAEAESLYHAAIRTWRASLGPDTWFIGKSLNNLTGMALAHGNYLLADTLSRLTLENWQKALDDRSVWIGYGLELRGIVMEFLGKPEEADKYYRQYVEHMERSLDPLDHELADARIRRADFLASQSRFREALEEYRRALESIERSGGPDDHVATILSKMSGAYFDVREYEQAEHLLARSLRIVDTLVITERREINACEQIAGMLQKQQRFQQALPLLEHSLGILQDIGASRHRSAGVLLQLTAEILARLGHRARADSVYSVLLPLQESLFGPRSIAVADALESLAWFQRTGGNPTLAFSHAALAFSIRQEHLSGIMTVQRELDALRSGSRLATTFDLLASSYFDLESPPEDMTRAFAEAALKLKGQVSDHLAMRRGVLIDAGSKGKNAFAAQYHEAKVRLSKLYVRGSSGTDPRRYRTTLDSLSRRIDELEIAFGQTNARFQWLLERQRVGVNNIVAKLPPASSLAEYVRFMRVGAGGGSEAHYAVVVVRKDGRVTVTDLGPAGRIEQEIGSYRAHFTLYTKEGSGPSTDEFRKIGSRLYALLWGPLQGSLKDGEQVFIAPDGALSLVSFATLLKTRDRFLIEDHQIHYVSTGRDFLGTMQDRRGTGLLAIGAPDLNTSLEPNDEITEWKNGSDSDGPVPFVARAVRSDCESLRDLKVPELPGALLEIEHVAEFWKEKEPSDSVIVLTGASASEGLFKQHCRGRKTIHLATHGYYLQGECPQQEMHRGGGNLPQSVENPLLHSGLFLAGSRHMQGGEPGEGEDGILTALEVSSLDLRGTDLVVLSACETGLGRVQQGEGVAGLRAAFQIAGAHTVLSTLWQVPDEETAKFMKLIYSPETKDYPALMQGAAIQALKEARARGRSAHPLTWGAFVATGDWRRR